MEAEWLRVQRVIRWPLFTALVVLSGLVNGLPAGWANPQRPRSVTVLSIGDGDTIRVLQDQQRITVRLACIDAPELAQAPHGAQARSYLQSRLRLGSAVTLRPHTVDRFGRTVAEVISGVNLNLALVEDGKAFAYRRYLGSCDARAYLDAELRASRRRQGVWQQLDGITRPWDFRRNRRAQRSAAAAGQGTRL
ncbi:thermonuclease family protein [Synechococcus sp. CS-1325]|uniref:thermonuclease family protein n=1 Tax=Synechococcus sp. CS-1325 TaxID=2847979 RepID=UPI000DB41744|nr:thermonuclease family protein [Synechococcus sp. CS-1325]MCT0199321.1 thermonuclease family protein [Synechococcus sp. CS-1325]PZV00164.1 MAG: nuclease [Cyanobium sp.]